MPRRALLTFVLAAAVGNPAAALGQRSPPDEHSQGRGGCGLDVLPLEQATTAACLACHQRGGPGHGSSHPVDVDYASAVDRAAGGGLPLRTLGEAIARGATLPDGQVRCVTCHASGSPWRYRLALPPGEAASPSVNPFDPETYEPGVPLRTRLENLRGRAGARPETGTRALCLTCHAAE